MQKRKLLFATHNLHKLEEVSIMLGNDIELLSLTDIHCTEDIPETSDTFEGNALQKASYIYNRYGIDCFADDSGLEVAALQGAPGIFSARYASVGSTGSETVPANSGHDSNANMHKLLHELQGVVNREAQFRTVIALLISGKAHFFEGIIRGKITENERGNNGFGYDPVFIPEGFNKTFAELPAEVKNKISHRAVSISKMCEFLKIH